MTVRDLLSEVDKSMKVAVYVVDDERERRHKGTYAQCDAKSFAKLLIKYGNAPVQEHLSLNRYLLVHVDEAS